MSIIIPSKLSNLLHGVTDEISAAIGSVFTLVTPILKRNESPFFPNYTDHGLQHVNNVLRTCELVISEDAWSVFTREDAAALILATLAHDLGMLISIEGFRSLVDPLRESNQLSKPDDEPWHKLWREFQLATRRFDGATLTGLLGSPEPVPLEELDPSHFTERGLIVVGDFLRRYHHRLAHEIVLFGMPSENGSIRLFDNIPQQLSDIVGLVARSHGESIRNCLDSCVKLDRTGHREYRYIHPTFLMTLVRLADYLDLDHGRAPTSILAAKSLKSPISRREWWAHRALVDCHSLTDDPECLHVVVAPAALPDIDTYLTIEDKIDGIQQELDSCWAVLGEVYGRFPPLNRLTLKIRRIRSDLRGPNIVDHLPFVPHRASLESSKSDLLKLLIAPLYGDEPSIGIRELLQNAIDAVRELEFTLAKSPSLKFVHQEDLGGDVVISFEKDSKDAIWIVVNDRGIGMTWETVCKYYLTAGASFRQSDAWKQKFTDDSGESQILRSGRFGVGILAAFLLGNNVQVSTRYIEEPEDKGIFFEFGLDDTSIEMKWMKRKPGTTIKIKTDPKTVDRLKGANYYQSNLNEKWDWFCLKKPHVVRKDIDGEILKQKYKLPDAQGKPPIHQHEIQVPGYQKVYWTYSEKHPGLVCNGILISKPICLRTEKEFRLLEKEPTYYNSELSLLSPKISIFDPDGHLPLNLARNKLASTPYELSSAIADDICENYIAFCLIKGPKARLLSGKQSFYYKIEYYPGISKSNHDEAPFFFDTNNGFGLCDPWNLTKISQEKLLVIRGRDISIEIDKSISDLVHKNYKVIIGSRSNNTLGDFDSWHRQMALYRTHYESTYFLRHMPTIGIRTLMPIKWYRRFIDKQPKYIINNIKILCENEQWIIWSLGTSSDTGDTLVSLANKFQDHQLPIESVTECFFSSDNGKLKQGRIAKMWQELIGGPIIPFNQKERQKIIDKIDGRFKRHLDEWSQT